MGCVIDELIGKVKNLPNAGELISRLSKLKDTAQASRKINIRSYDPNASELEKKYQALSNLNAKVAHYNGKTFKTIEHAFQYAKAKFFSDKGTEEEKKANRRIMRLLEEANRPYLIKVSGSLKLFPIGTKAAGVKAEQQNGDKARYPDFGSYAFDLGQRVKGFDPEKWGEVSDKILEDIMEDHYRTNMESQKLLLETGNMTLVHEVKDKKYAELFPKLLMKIRDKLKNGNGVGPKQGPVKPGIKQEKDTIIDRFNKEGC